MKPTLRVHFSQERPNRPGLWLNRRQHFISVLQVDESDVERDKRQGNWLDGEWAAELDLVGHDMLPMDRKTIQEHLDTLISNANQNAKTDVRDALQELRFKLLGERLELPDPPLLQSDSNAGSP